MKPEAMTNDSAELLISWFVTRGYVTEDERTNLIHRWAEGDKHVFSLLDTVKAKFDAGEIDEDELATRVAYVIAPKEEQAEGKSKPFIATALTALGAVTIVLGVGGSLLQLDTLPIGVVLGSLFGSLIGGAVLIGLGDIIELLARIHANQPPLPSDSFG